MRALVKVLTGFNEPNGTRHEVGETIELDEKQVPDLEYLVLGGTLEIVSVIKERVTTTFKPNMETKGSGNL